MQKSNPRRLSDQGQSQKQAMLRELHCELERLNERRSFRNRAASKLAIVVFAGATLAFSYLFNHSAMESNSESSAPTPKLSYASVESNRQSVSERYVVSNDQNSSFSFESLSDDELVALLKSAGDKFVLGEINGQKMLLPARMTP